MLTKWFIFISFFSCNLLQAEGFIAGTLVATNYGLIPIECINIGDSIGNEHFVIKTQKVVADSFIRLHVGNTFLETTTDQKFYEPQKSWMNAYDISVSDKLVCYDGSLISVNAIEIIEQKQTHYILSVETNHIFYVTPHGIITHNLELISGGAAIISLTAICPPAAAGLAIVEAITAGIVCFGAYCAYKKHQKKKKQKKDCVEQNKVVNSSSGGGKDPKDEDDDPNKHPHGIYKDAPYHTADGNSIKGPRPKNGQLALDNSVPLGGNSTGRVGISEGEIVILRKTSERLYHGYVSTWRELLKKGSATQTIINALTKNKLVSQSGEIISTIITKKG